MKSCMIGVSGFVLTDEQESIVYAAVAGKSMSITAYAGASKTTTLVEIASHPAMRGRRGLYLAFGADAKKDAEKKFKGLNVDVLTTHGLAFRWLNESHPAVTPSYAGYRGHEIAEKYNIAPLRQREWKVRGDVISSAALGYIIIEWVSRFCGTGDDEISINHCPVSSLSGYPKRLSPTQARSPIFQKEINDEKRRILLPYLDYAKRLWGDIRSKPTENPITHDNYMKMWSLSRPIIPYDYVMLDEAQDTNGAVIAVLNANNLQKIVVGDSHQSIYQFRGAMDAMTKIKTEWEYRLSMSFRYGDSVASLASAFLSAVKPKSVAITGAPSRTTNIECSLTGGC